MVLSIWYVQPWEKFNWNGRAHVFPNCFIHSHSDDGLGIEQWKQTRICLYWTYMWSTSLLKSWLPDNFDDLLQSIEYDKCQLNRNIDNIVRTGEHIEAWTCCFVNTHSRTDANAMRWSLKEWLNYNITFHNSARVFAIARFKHTLISVCH